MSSNQHLERTLAELGERVFNGGAVRRTPARQGMTGLKIVGAKKAAAAHGSSNRSTRQSLTALLKRRPQVLVRISGGGKGIRQVKAHLDYISRNGQIEVEDQNGDKFNGKDEINTLRDEWQMGGFPIPESSGVKQAFNIVLSMPAGTNEFGVRQAAADFARREFENYQYAMALHTFDTDPDKNPSPNPHVHLCVKALGLDGTRLNPRKAELQRWREGFAQALRENGIEAEATKRIHRLQPKRGEKQSVQQKKARGESFHSIGSTPISAQRIAIARQAQSDVLRGYREIAQALARSGDPTDRSLAVALVRHLSPDVAKPGVSPVRER
jgi:hypothetical protein